MATILLFSRRSDGFWAGVAILQFFLQCICLSICPVVDGAAKNVDLHHEFFYRRCVEFQDQ